MNAKERKKLARAQSHRAERMKDVELGRRVAVSLSGCSARVYKAVNSLPLRSEQDASSDNICLPDVAIYSAGHRKSENITAR
ncbi:MAG: hypothetical protein WBR21_08430 [Rouxiella badensis]|uniref:transcriptional antitermination N peptide n=1 Tax=Rouxiella badensis TaxID=1646377 RepID=UPI003C40F4A9